MAVLESKMEALWTPLESCLVYRRRENRPRALNLRRVGLGDCRRVIVARTKTMDTTTVACVTTYLRVTSALVMQTNLRWSFLCWGGVVLSR